MKSHSCKLPSHKICKAPCRSLLLEHSFRFSPQLFRQEEGRHVRPFHWISCRLAFLCLCRWTPCPLWPLVTALVWHLLELLSEEPFQVYLPIISAEALKLWAEVPLI